MEKKKKTKIQKWDEVRGMTEVEIDEGSVISEEKAGDGPSLSREVMRALEDLLEQNDNSLDGVINNLPVPKDENAQAVISAQEDERKKKSILEKLQEGGVESEKPAAIPMRYCLGELERC
jgi:succinate dehydrogenase flavin-adding protein (antitoxin of CptAB toxin-antitoxin module)